MMTTNWAQTTRQAQACILFLFLYSHIYIHYRLIYNTTTAQHNRGNWVYDSQQGPNDAIRRLALVYFCLIIYFFKLTYIYIIGSSTTPRYNRGIDKYRRNQSGL